MNSDTSMFSESEVEDTVPKRSASEEAAKQVRQIERRQERANEDPLQELFRRFGKQEREIKASRKETLKTVSKLTSTEETVVKRVDSHDSEIGP